jgi:activating signal cointegrator complex subunit 1
LCIPLSGPQLARTLSSFRADVTDPNSFNVHPQAVRPLGTMHLTLGVMTLKGDEALGRAADLLRGLRLREILDQARAAAASARATTIGQQQEEEGGPGLTVTLQGLGAMQAPSKTSVVYAPPLDPGGLLRRFCELVRGRFQEAGVMAQEERPLLLHATVVNTIYIGDRRLKRVAMDARDLMAKYDGHTWLEDMPVERVTLCKMGAKKVEGELGEAYEVESEVEF